MASKTRKIALEYYKKMKYAVQCAYCGLSLDLLEAAHIDHNNKNNDPSNFVFLCPTCHRMLDLGMIPQQVIRTMRKHPKIANWDILRRGKSAKQIKELEKELEKEAELIEQMRSEAAKKAWKTRRKNEKARKAKDSE